MKLGQRIRSIRKEKNLSGQELASLSGVSQSTISRVERDEQSPTIETLINICRVLEVKLSDLLFEELEPVPPHILRLIEVSKKLTEKELKKLVELIEIFIERSK